MAWPQTALSLDTDLSDPHPIGFSDPQWLQDLTSLRERAHSFQLRYTHQVFDLSPLEIASAIQELDSIQTQYAQLDTSVRSQAPQPWDHSITTTLATIDQQLHFWAIELQQVPPETLEQTLTHLSPPSRYGFVQWHQRIQAYPSVTMPEGDQANSLLTLNQLLYHPHPDIRLEAYQSVRQVLEQHNGLYGLILNSLIQTRHQEALSSNDGSVLLKQLQDQDCSYTAFEAILESTRERVDLFQQFYRLKAKATGRSVRICDLWSPWELGSHLELDQQDNTFILQALREFHPDYGQYVRLPSAPTLPLKLGVNPIGLHCDYRRSLRCVPHAVLSKLQLLDPQPLSLKTAVLTESSSILNQLLVLDSCLKLTSDAETQAALLTYQLENQINALFHQGLITRFELELYTLAQQGPLTQHFINEVWLRLSQDLCGDAVELLPDHQFDWAEISPLFGQPFSFYAATLGMVVGLACYQNYKHQGRDFTSKYLTMLETPSQPSLESSLNSIGIDLESSVELHQALDLTESLLDQLEEALER